MGGVGIFGFLVHEAVIGYRLGRDTHEILTFPINTDSQRGFALLSFDLFYYFFRLSSFEKEFSKGGLMILLNMRVYQVQGLT